MAQRKKRPKPVPAVAGGEVMTGGGAIEAPDASNTATKDTVVDVRPGNAAPEKGSEEVVEPADGDIEMADKVNQAPTGPATTTQPAEDTTTVIAGQSNVDIAQQVVDNAMMVDTDNTDSAQVEDTI